MPTLEFFEDSHTYLLDGVIIPSVSEVLKPLSMGIYDDVPEFIMEKARVKGHAVHKAVEDFENEGVYYIEEKWSEYVNAYLMCKQKYGFEVIHSEQQVASELGYAGTIDIVGEMNGKTILIDLKTTKELHVGLVSIQLSLYKKAMEETLLQYGKRIDEIYALQLKSNGQYVLQKLDYNWEVAEALLTIWKYKNKINESEWDIHGS